MKRAFVWVLCFLLFETMLAADAFAIRLEHPPAPPKPTHIGNLIDRLGTGTDAVVAVRLRDKSVAAGYVAETARGYFVVVDPQTGRERTVAYAQVERLQGYNLTTGAEVHQGVGWRAKLVRTIAHLSPRPHPQANSLTGGEKTLLIGIAVGILLAIILAKAL